MQIAISVPDDYALNYTHQEIARNLKLSAALLMFRAGQISAGAACEFADVDRYAFLAACNQHHIAVIDYDEDEIEADVERLTGRHQKC